MAVGLHTHILCGIEILPKAVGPRDDCGIPVVLGRDETTAAKYPELILPRVS